MKYRITKSDKVLKGTIDLEGSKSITNRVLIVKALCPDYFDVLNYSTSEDSQDLLDLLNSPEPILRVRDGGTTLRFLLAFLSIHEGQVILTGSKRLNNRPVGPLVEALRTLGAEIEYIVEEGYPPLLVFGKKFNVNKVEVDATMSSQFISALLLIAPVLQDGLIIQLKGEVVSRSYIQMTLDVMKHFGINHEWTQSVISIRHQEYSGRKFTVEGDWSTASYFYSMAALSDEVDLTLKGLNRISLQGDAVIADIMRQFGVQSEYVEGGIRLTKSETKPRSLEYDFIDCPDLVQTVVACCAGKQVALKMRGVKNLHLKETNRLNALDRELRKLDLHLTPLGNTWNLGVNLHPHIEGTLNFDSYHDHRMAMAFTPLAIPYGSVIIDNPAVVHKSYPKFWETIQQLGFEIEEL